MDFSPAQSYKYVFIWKSYMCIFCAFNTLLSHFVNFDWIYWKFNCASYNPIYIVYYIKRQIRGNNYRDNSNNFLPEIKYLKSTSLSSFQNSIVLISLLIIILFM